MPGRLCAVPVLEFKSLKSGREKPPTALDDTRWVELLVLHPRSRLMLYHWAFVDWPYLMLWQLQHERAHLRSFFNTWRENTGSQQRRKECGGRKQSQRKQKDNWPIIWQGESTDCLFITQTPLSPTKLSYSKKHKHDSLFCYSWLSYICPV